MLNAAIIGLGRWGRILVDAVQTEGTPRGGALRVSTLVTRTVSDEVKAYAARQKLRLATLDEALADRTLGAILLATPHSQHGAQILAGARAGKHVFCEKPVTLTRAEIDAGIEACRRAGVVLAAGFNRRFMPAGRALRAAARDGRLGQILHLEGHASSPSGFGFAPGSWRLSGTESPAGSMGAMGIHMIDQLIWINGPISAVACQSLRQALTVPLDDTTSMLLRFRNGSTATFSTLAATARCWQLRVLGTKGWAQLRDDTRVETVPLQGAPTSEGFEPADLERAELEAFAAACAGTAAYPVPLDEVANGVSTWEAIARSAARDGAWTVVA
ncbi:MAG: Gfo/Idh/MocA family oxidoreductase [Alphaproteobacteria bacterium]|nr:Gfo/Idh/MocA family oxidoreductase [Alphaproteobacteria bacterium]